MSSIVSDDTIYMQMLQTLFLAVPLLKVSSELVSEVELMTCLHGCMLFVCLFTNIDPISHI